MAARSQGGGDARLARGAGRVPGARCPYTAQELTDELVRRNEARSEGKVIVFEEFILEALSGDL